MRINTKQSYDPFDKKKVPFLRKDEDTGRIFNGPHDVTDAPKRLTGVRTGKEKVSMCDYLVYRPLPKAIVEMRNKPDVHPDSYDMQLYYKKIKKAMTEGVYVREEYFNPMFMFWIIVFVFEIPIYDKDGRPTGGFELGRPTYSVIDRYVFDLIWKGFKLRKYIAFIGGRGLGKLQLDSTLTPTPSGDVAFGSLNVGDEIFTLSGKTTRVTAIKQYDVLPMYTMTTADRRSTNCSTGHLWEVYKRGGGDKLYTISAIDIAEEVTYEGKPGKTANNYFLPIAGRVDFPEKEQIIDPYMLGYLLGNGSYTKGGCRVATDDFEVIDAFAEILGEEYQLTPDPTSNNYYIKYLGKDQKIDKRGILNRTNNFTEKLKTLKMFGKNTFTKRIPDNYKYGSYEQRLALVQGMMDSDGHAYATRASSEYYSVNEGLIEDLAYVVRSLGIKCTLGKDVRDGELYGYRLFIYTGEPIFRLPRKKERLKTDEEVSLRIRRFRYRTAIVGMDVLETQETGRCIEVDSSDGTYLTNDFITTHNSFITDSVLMWYYMLFDNQKIIVSATNLPVVEEAWDKVKATIRNIEDEYEGFAQHRETDSNTRIVAEETYYDERNKKKSIGSHNDIRRIIYADNPGATKGRRPDFQHIEEFAAFPSHPSKGCLKNVLGQTKGSWVVQATIRRAFVIMTGTGGSVGNADAEDIFMNLAGHNFLTVNEWGAETGLFIPAQLKLGGNWEVTGVPDVAAAIELLLESRRELESDPVSYLIELQEFPMTLHDVFLRKGTNEFNQDKISDAATALMIMKPKPWKQGKLAYTYHNSQIVGVEFIESVGGDFWVLEEPERGTDGVTLKNLYVGGLDSIDQGNKDSLVEGSKLAFLVKKRISNAPFQKTSEIYVAKYIKRSDDIRWDYEVVLKAAIWYNLKVNLEYTKHNVISYFKEKKQFFRLLKRPSVAIGSNVSARKASTLIGTTATPAMIAHMDLKVGAYIDDYCHQIYFPDLLDQLRDYDSTNRTKSDLVVAMGLCELADEELMGKVAMEDDTAAADIELIGTYRDRRGRKRWGAIPQDRREIRSIAEEEFG